MINEIYCVPKGSSNIYYNIKTEYSGINDIARKSEENVKSVKKYLGPYSQEQSSALTQARLKLRLPKLSLPS